MKMFKCYDCGVVFDEPYICEEAHGEKFGCCPRCKGSFDEAKKCEICDEYFLEDELNGRLVCDDCIEEQKRNLEICYKVSGDEKEEVKINALLASLFDTYDIEEILYERLCKEKIVDCSKFIEQDKYWFAEKLVEVLKDEVK